MFTKVQLYWNLDFKNVKAIICKSKVIHVESLLIILLQSIDDQN